MSGSQASSAATAGPRTLKLKRGDLLFSEGDNSTAMFLLKSGSIRVFKKKGTSFIELDTIRSGQIIGELAFLDGLPRSASCEAIQDCELIEISGATFTETMTRIPEWLKALLKTIVTRLRASSNKIRQLESANQGLDYSKDEKAQVYLYLPQSEAVKVAATLLLIASRHQKRGAKGFVIPPNLMQRYGTAIYNIPSSKFTSFMDILMQCGLASGTDTIDGPIYEVFDIDAIEEFVEFLHAEMGSSTLNRRDLSLRGFLVMSYILKHIGDYRTDPNVDEVTVDIAAIQRKEGLSQDGKPPFKIDEIEELVRMDFVGPLQYPSDDSRTTKISYKALMKAYRIQRVLKSIDALNEQKRKTMK